MDKFTVDLEKVLDEFEYNEGREEAVLPPAIRNHSYPRNSPKPLRPPAAAYRRPTFEPISLTDADFSADPSSVSGQIINVGKHKIFSDQVFNCLNENSFNSETIPQLPKCEDLNSLNRSETSSRISFDENGSEDIHESPKPSDETPDLLDSNSLKSRTCADQENSSDKAQLPDITSVHSYSEPEEDIKTVEELDLIKRHSIIDAPDSDASDDLPPIVGIDTVIKAGLPDLQITPLTFDSVEISDSDLVSYLDSLDRESSAINNSASDDITDCIVNTPLESVSFSESNLSSGIVQGVSCSDSTSTDDQILSPSFLSSSELDKNSEIISCPSVPSIISESVDQETPATSDSLSDSSYNRTPAQPKESTDITINSEVGSISAEVAVSKNFSEEESCTTSDTDDQKDIVSIPADLLDTKLKYSICLDVSDEYADEPEEPVGVAEQISNNIVGTSRLNFTASDLDNGNIPEKDLSTSVSEVLDSKTDQREEVNDETLTRVLNLNTISDTLGDSEIKREVICDSAFESEPRDANISGSERQINRIIIKVPSEDSDQNSCAVTEETPKEAVINENTDCETAVKTEIVSVSDSVNENSNCSIAPSSQDEVAANGTVEDNSLTNHIETSTYSSVTCLPAQTTNQVFVVEGVSEATQESIECFDNKVNTDSDELVQNLQNIETEREEIDNRDNEEKVVLGLDSENNDATNSGNSDYFYQGETTGSSDTNSTDFDMKPSRPSTLAIPHSHIVTDSEESPTPSNSSSPSVGGVMSPEERTLGKRPPYWVPDTETDSCMLCNAKFTVIKRRHHCRACGLVLCSKCCNLKAPLEYMGYAEARVCQPCFNIIYRVGLDEGRYNRGRQPNPNNPMEYCSTVPPLQQVSAASASAPPAVFVPTSVLKREGRARSDTPKQVMFSDGIRPGGDLTELDGSNETPRLLPRRSSFNRKMHGYRANNNSLTEQIEKRPLDPSTQSFIPAEGNLPPMVTVTHGNITFLPEQLTSVGSEPVKFAINYNLFINVKRVKLNCCVNREVWSVCSEGLCLVGQDEVAFILETLPEETLPHVDIFHLVNYLWKQAALGSTASEMCFTVWFSYSLLGSNDHGGFLYIRPSLQCTTNLLLPSQPYLIALLVHRWETGWARLFPLRLVLRLGAEYRYYPCPLVSVRNRQPLYTDIGHTIMKILADFRKFSYSLATVRGMVIHIEDKQTTILFPRNRYDQVTRALNNSNESVLAFGANLSLAADSHLVCIQGAKDENTYHTEAINIHNKPRKVTGASFVVFNGALKGSGTAGKSSILEDGLMVHLAPDRMAALRSALRSMHDFSLPCGPDQDETVLIHWTSDDTNFNVGVRSFIDNQPLDGVPSIRVHNGTDYTANPRLIRWTEVFILQCEDGVGEPVDVSRVSESISRAACNALVPLLDSLSSNDLNPLSIRATIHQDNVGYDAGSKGEKLPSQYMRRLDDELVPVLHQAAMSQPMETPVVLELIFRIMLMP